MYLVVDDYRRASLWGERPAYFSDSQRWGSPAIPILSSAFFPPLEKIAADLGIVPGREGILEVTFALAPVGSER